MVSLFLNKYIRKRLKMSQYCFVRDMDLAEEARKLSEMANKFLSHLQPESKFGVKR